MKLPNRVVTMARGDQAIQFPKINTAKPYIVVNIRLDGRRCWTLARWSLITYTWSLVYILLMISTNGHRCWTLKRWSLMTHTWSLLTHTWPFLTHTQSLLTHTSSLLSHTWSFTTLTLSIQHVVFEKEHFFFNISNAHIVRINFLSTWMMLCHQTFPIV